MAGPVYRWFQLFSPMKLLFLLLHAHAHQLEFGFVRTPSLPENIKLSFPISFLRPARDLVPRRLSSLLDETLGRRVVLLD